MAQITIELFLYGALAAHGKSETPGCSNILFPLPADSTIGDLLKELKLPTQERGITFVNGNLSALPGMQHDLGHVLQDKDRVAFFDLKSMWPFQYRQGVQMTGELSEKLAEDPQKNLHHDYTDTSSDSAEKGHPQES